MRFKGLKHDLATDKAEERLPAKPVSEKKLVLWIGSPSRFIGRPLPSPTVTLTLPVIESTGT